MKEYRYIEVAPEKLQGLSVGSEYFLPSLDEEQLDKYIIDSVTVDYREGTRILGLERVG